MPIFKDSTFKAPFYCSNPHLQTMYPSLFRKVRGLYYDRERFELEDGDFIDLDYSRLGADKLVIVLHGLEGDANRPYVQGMVKLFNQNGWDGVGINFRGCSGEHNRLAQTYHSGATNDLDALIQKIDRQGHYQNIVLIGFSLGGNVTLKYVGEQGKSLNPKIKKAIVYSVPIHLESASYELAKWQNSLYMKRFMNNLKVKVRERAALLQEYVDLDKVYAAKSFLDFDEYFTAPIFGFKNAIDYWTLSSSKQFLENIAIPTLLVNAKDDSFLSTTCYPYEEAKASKNFFLETPEKGGHVGFVGADRKGFYWSEQRALQFALDTY